MKLKNRRDDASAPETDEWAKMNDWFAELRDDRPAGPARRWPRRAGPRWPRRSRARHGLGEPARAWPRPSRPVMASRSRPVMAWPSPRVMASPSRPAMAAAGPEPPPRRLPTAPHRETESVPAPKSFPSPRSRSGPLSAISCGCRPHGARWAPASGATPIPRRSARLTPAPARSRPAWRVDALGRLACPRCQQTSSGFRASRPVILWDRDTALASAALTIAVTRDRAVGNRGRPAAGVIGAGPLAAIPRQSTPGTAPETPWPPPCPPDGRPAQQHATPAPRHRRSEAPAGQQVMSGLAWAS